MAWSGALGSLALVRGERGELCPASCEHLGGGEFLSRQRHRRALSLTPLNDGISLLNKRKNSPKDQRTKSVDYSTLKGGEPLIPLLQITNDGECEDLKGEDEEKARSEGIVVPAICVIPSGRIPDGVGKNDR